MAGYNKVILLGRLTRDPQLSYLPSQTAVVDMGLATSRNWKGQDGQMKEEVCFIDCRMFGKRAEVVNKYFKKGSPIFVEGRLTFDSWQGQDGVKKSKLRVTVENFEFVGSAPNSGSGGSGSPQQSRPEQPAEQGGFSQPNAGPVAEDDIPF